jgi:hypothetical protein
VARIHNVVFDAPYGGSLELYASKAGAIATLYAALLGQPKMSRARMYEEANYPFDEGDEADPLVRAVGPDDISIAFELQSEG